MTEKMYMRFEFQVDLKATRHKKARRRLQPRQSKLFQSLLLAHQLQQLFQSGKADDTTGLAWTHPSPV